MNKALSVTRKPRIINIKPSRRSQNLRLPTHVPKPIYNSNYRNVACKSFDTLEDVITASYFIGKGVILFTMFYTGLNYFHYKKLREEAEEDGDDKKSKK